MSYIGKSVKRVEDKRFITGKGRYTDDIKLANMAAGVFVRSPYAHATIKSIDTSAAEKMPGVARVFTGQDMAEVNGVPCGWQVDFKNGDTMKEPPHPILVKDKALHMGDGVAFVVADTYAQAKDAAEKVRVDYDIHAAVHDPQEAVKAGAPQVHADAPNNTCFDWALGDPIEEVDAALAAAHHVTTLDDMTNQRVVPNAIEPRSAIGHYEDAYDKYTLYTTSQNPHLTRLLMSAFVLGIPEHKVHVIAPDVGGGFGSKIFHYIEEVMVVWASKHLGRPIKWTAERSESFLTDAHGRDHKTTVSMGFDADGKIVALKSKTFANLGAYLSTFAPAVPTYLHGTLMQGLYTTPLINVDVTGVFTHTNAVDAYRGAGRPEATYQLERLMDLAALEMGIDPAELRRRNFIPAFDGVNEEGYATRVALQYDSGNYDPVLDRALEMVGYEDFRKEQKSLDNGKLIGIGFSTYIEACGIAPSAVVGALGARAGLFESAQVRVQPTGKVSVYSGSHSHGQGHETTFAQVVADKLGIPLEDVEIVHGDSESVAFGMGTYGSRSLAVGGSAIVKSIDKVLEKGAKIAAHKLESRVEDLDYADGKWTVKGTDKSIAFGDVSLTAYVPHDYPADLEPGLDFSSFYDPTNFTYPFGCHVAIVEVDKETGVVKLKRFIAVDDVGNIINPMIVDGQIHGGLAQGIGQALFEGTFYDESGTLLNGSFMDYAMPRADDLPNFEVDRKITPCPHNPLGVKGAGEAGCIGSTPAVVNAVIDALWSGGHQVKDIDMPLIPERVWKAMQNGSAN